MNKNAQLKFIEISQVDRYLNPIAIKRGDFSHINWQKNSQSMKM